MPRLFSAHQPDLGWWPAGDVASLLQHSTTLMALSDLHALLALAAKQARPAAHPQPRRRNAHTAGRMGKEAGGQDAHAETAEAGSGSGPDGAREQQHSDTDASKSMHSSDQRPKGRPGDRAGRAAAKEAARTLLHAERKAWFMLVGAQASHR